MAKFEVHKKFDVEPDKKKFDVQPESKKFEIEPEKKKFEIKKKFEVKPEGKKFEIQKKFDIKQDGNSEVEPNSGEPVIYEDSLAEVAKEKGISDSNINGFLKNSSILG